jgi:hypothetical protein
MLRLSLPCLLMAIAICAPTPVCAGKPRQCVTADEAAKMLNKEVCISAHVYDVVRLSDGTRFLDVCSPETPDAQCRFTIVSFWQDQDLVGELQKYRDMNVQIRGIVEPMHGRAGMILSHARQFNGGQPRFRPNPMLLRGFSGEQDRNPVNDPEANARGGRRSFMNTRDRESVPNK